MSNYFLIFQNSLCYCNNVKLAQSSSLFRKSGEVGFVLCNQLKFGRSKHGFFCLKRQNLTFLLVVVPEFPEVKKIAKNKPKSIKNKQNRILCVA